MQTARHVWDQLLVVDPVVLSALSVTASQAIYAQLQKAAEEQARSIYESLKHEHIDYISRGAKKQNMLLQPGEALSTASAFRKSVGID